MAVGDSRLEAALHGWAVLVVLCGGTLEGGAPAELEGGGGGRVAEKRKEA